MSSILHRVRIQAPPARVFAGLTKADEVRRWWTAEVELADQIGGLGRFGFGGDRVKMARIEAMEHDQRLAWGVTACFLPEWVGTRIEFTLEPHGEETLLHFTHSGFPDDCGCLAMCTTGWGFYLERLRRLCEGLRRPVSDSPFVVHSIPGSPFGRAVLAMLEEKGAPYRLAPVAAGTFRSEPHILRHPFGKVPVLEGGGIEIYEVQAILRHLDRVLPEPGMTPGDPRAAAQMDQAMNINDWYLFQGVGNVIGFHRIVGPRLMGLAPDEAAIAAAMPQAHRVIGELSRLLGDAPYLAGGAMSLADLMVAPYLDFLAQTPEWGELTSGRDNLRDYLVRIEARPSMQATTWAKVSEMAGAA